jgi:hypothetical protein
VEASSHIAFGRLRVPLIVVSIEKDDLCLPMSVVAFNL